MVAHLKTFHNPSTPIHNVRVACDVKGFIGSFNGLLPPNGAPRRYRRIVRRSPRRARSPLPPGSQPTPRPLLYYPDGGGIVC